MTSPSAFRAGLLVDADGAPRRLGDILDHWQRADFEALDPAWQRVAGYAAEGGRSRAWLERPRGHSKTSDVAVSVSWALAFAKRRISGVAAAADKDQAKLLRDAIATLCQLNPPLAQLLDVQSFRVVNRRTGSALEIISADVASSWGVLPDFVILDEVTHWAKRDLFDSLISAAAKRKNCLVFSIANAGFRASWQWKLRELIRTDPNWYFHALDGPRASWITQDRLGEQQRLLPYKAFARLWRNEWSDGTGDALDAALIDAAVTLRGPSLTREPGWCYLAGLDLGLSRDSSALAVVAKHVGRTVAREQPARASTALSAAADLGLIDAPAPVTEYTTEPGTGRLKLVCLEVWTPSNGNKVSIDAVEKAVIARHDVYRLHRLARDPWQSEHLGERLTTSGVPCEAVPFVPGSLQEMATATLDTFRERQLELFDDERLIADLKAMRVVERSYGFRLESPRGTEGGTRHGDAATALSLALLLAKRIGTGAPRRLTRPLIVA